MSKSITLAEAWHGFKHGTAGLRFLFTSMFLVAGLSYMAEGGLILIMSAAMIWLVGKNLQMTLEEEDKKRRWMEDDDEDAG